MRWKKNPASLSKERIRALIGLEPVILEIGCNDGTDTLEFLEAFGAGLEIHCFECDPRPIAAFRASVHDARCVLHEVAVSDTDGLAVFHQSGGSPVGAPKKGWDLSRSLRRPTGHLTVHAWCTFPSQITVVTRTLDRFLAEHPHLSTIDFAWIDVQGNESRVIRGGRLAFARMRYAYLECPKRAEYEGQLGLDQLLEVLGPTWRAVERFKGHNVLCENTAFASRIASR